MTKNEVRKHLIEADLFLFPTYTEGFSNALLEAMSVGLPIITTGVGANSDMIENYGGIITDVGNTYQIIQAIKKIANSELRQFMGEWNLQKVKEEYTIDHVMESLIKIYPF